MKKNYKRMLAVLCAVAMLVPMVNMNGITKSGVAATEAATSTENEYTMNFGEEGNDTYLQTEKALDAMPQAIEADMQMDEDTVLPTEWAISENQPTPTADDTGFFGDSNAKEYTTLNKDEPGAGKKFFEFTTTSTVDSANWMFDAVNVSRFEANELALSFWVWSETAGKIFDAGGIRVQNASNKGYQIGCGDIYVESGWTHITTAPMSTWTVLDANVGLPDMVDRVSFINAKSTTGHKMIIGDIKIVNIDQSDFTEWTLHEGGDVSLNSGDTANFFTSSGTATAPDGQPYIEFKMKAETNTSFSLTTKGSEFYADIAQYKNNKGALALQFYLWCDKTTTPFTDGRLNLSSSKGNANDSEPVYYVTAASAKTDNVGEWKLVTLPLNANYGEVKKAVESGLVYSTETSSEWYKYFRGGRQAFVTGEKNSDGNFTNGSYAGDEAVVFEQGVSTFKFHGVNNITGVTQKKYTEDYTVRIGEVKLVVLDKQYLEMDYLVSSTAKPTADDTGFFGDSNAKEYTTLNKDEPGAGKKFFEFTTTSTVDSANWMFDAVNVSRFEANELALSFWVWSETAGKIFDAGGIRVQNASNKGYQIGCGDIYVESGWTHITTAPMSTWTVLDANVGLPDMVDRVSFINAKSTTGHKMIIGDIKIVNIDQSDFTEWTLHEGGDVSLNSGDTANFFTSSGTATAPDGQPYIEFKMKAETNTSFSLTTKGSEFYADIAQYKNNKGALALQFYLWCDKTTTPFTDGRLNLSSSKGNANDSEPVYYVTAASAKTDNVGEWKLVTLPLNANYGEVKKAVESGLVYSTETSSEWYKYFRGGRQAFVTGEKNSDGNFTNGSYAGDEAVVFEQGVSTFKFHGVNNITGVTQKKYTEDYTVRIGEVKLVVLDSDTDVNVKVSPYNDTTTENANYTVFSNTNNANETSTNKFGLFITREGYPALRYGDTQYTLQQNITGGESAKKIKAGINADNKVEFSIGGSVVGTSDDVVTLLSGGLSTKYSIGADANGNQLMKGSIANVKIFSDATGEKCIGNWALNGQIDWVLNTFPDTSGNEVANDVVYVTPSKTEEEKEQPVIISDLSATGGVMPHKEETIMNGYKFAGWFTDEKCETPLKKDETSLNASAKFVDAKIMKLSGAMISKGTTKDSSTTDLLFVSTVDTLDYKEVGFRIALDGGKQLTKKYTRVYEQLMGEYNSGDVETWTPTQNNSTQSTKFSAFLIKGVTNAYFGTDWTVEAYWETLDGTEVYGPAGMKTVNMGITASESKGE